MNFLKFVFFLFSLFVVVHIFPKEVHAYIDPGSGSYIFQIVLGAIFGAGIALKLFWNNVLNFFRKLLGKKVYNEEKSDKETS